jgi:hypothetical protein
VELVDRTDARLSQVEPALVQNGDRVGVTFPLRWSGAAPGCGGVDAIVLAAASSGQLPDPCGGCGGHVDDAFALVSAYYLICRSPYDLTCRSVSAR